MSKDEKDLKTQSNEELDSIVQECEREKSLIEDKKYKLGLEICKVNEKIACVTREKRRRAVEKRRQLVEMSFCTITNELFTDLDANCFQFVVAVKLHFDGWSLFRFSFSRYAI